MSIYTNVVSLITEAVNDIQSAVSSIDFGPEYPTIPAVDFSSSISGAVPGNPTYTPNGPPTTGITGVVDKAAYNAASSVVGSLSNFALPDTLTYLDPVHPAPLPEYGYPTPAGAPPESPFVAVQDSAGLQQVDSPVIAVGTPRELSPIPNLAYDSYGFDQLDVMLHFQAPALSAKFENIDTRRVVDKNGCFTQLFDRLV